MSSGISQLIYVKIDLITISYLQHTNSEQMVCSNCKQAGHKRSTCKNPTIISPPSVKPALAAKPLKQEKAEPMSEPPTEIKLPEDVKRKLGKLSDLCHEVASGLGKGHVEGVYQQALIFELQEAGVRYVSEETMPILYKGRPIGGCHSQRLDIALMSYLPFIFELKAVSKPISSEHHWQLVRYLDYKKQDYGAVVNFNQSDKGSLEVQFVVRQNGVFYLYDLASETGTELSDFGLIKTADEWGWELPPFSRSAPQALAPLASQHAFPAVLI